MGTVGSCGVASIIFILGIVVVSGSSLTTGVGLPGVGLPGALVVWGLAVERHRRLTKEPLESAVGSSSGAWEGASRTAVQTITVPSTEPVANLGYDELWSQATLVNAVRPGDILV